MLNFIHSQSLDNRAGFMQKMQPKESVVPWKAFLTVTAETLLSFYLATFCIIMFFLHRGPNWWLQGILLGLLYLFVIIACAKRTFATLPLSAIMLIIPIAPLLALIIVISLIPVFQLFQ